MDCLKEDMILLPQSRDAIGYLLDHLGRVDIRGCHLQQCFTRIAQTFARDLVDFEETAG